MSRICLTILINACLFLTPGSLRDCMGDDLTDDVHVRIQDAGTLALPCPDGSAINLAFDGSRFQVFCFVGCECPLAKFYGPRLSALSDEFSGPRFEFIGVNSNQQDSMADVGEYIKNYKISFPVVKDYDNRLADILSAKRTPEVVIVSPDLKVVYRGRVDDQYSPGVVRRKATRHDLAAALRQLADGVEVTTSKTPVEGCLIGRTRNPKSAATVTYSKQVAGILNQHCIECHRSDDIGPFSLTNYDDATGWAEMIVEVIDDGRMPPWHASDKHRPLLNSRSMPESDKQVLRDWLESGTPFGSADELPPPQKFTNGWRLPRKPDLILQMNKPGYQVPSQGVVDYQYFVVDPGFKEDKWVAAAEVKPGNASVTHHSIVFIRPPDGADFKGFGMLTAYVPGQSPPPYQESYAKRIPAGSKFVFQQHYTPNGRAEMDNSSLGLIFVEPDQVSHELFTIIGLEQQFEIPARESHFKVSVTLPRLPKQGVLLSVAPHMHYRGKSFMLKTIDKSGNSQTALEVPHYDFNWQHSYRFKEPLDFSNISEINFTATFDNSDGNPFNPNPEISVFWGDQTFEEMAVAFFEVAQPRNLESKKSTEVDSSNSLSKPTTSAKDATVVKNFFERFDRNNDGRIMRSEVTKAMKHFAFRTYDSNGDDQITRDELLEHLSIRR